MNQISEVTLPADALSVSGRAPSDNPDAAVIALEQEFWKWRKAHNAALDAQEAGLPGGDEAVVDQTGDAYDAAIDKMEVTPARTYVGLAAKAKIIKELDDTFVGADLIDSLVQDCIKLQEVAADDADLIRICQEHPRNIAAFNANDDDGDDSNPLWVAYKRTRDAIHDARPMTLPGMVAKARAAKAEALQPDGSEQPNNCPAENWAWDLVNDLVRLGVSTARPAENPDAKLIALCQEFIDLEQAVDDMFPGGPNSIVDDKARGVAIKPLEDRQTILAEEIADIPFKTMEGARMIARAAACWAKDIIENGFAELGGLHGDLYFTLVKGLIGENV